MRGWENGFEQHMRVKRNASPTTIDVYRADVAAFDAYLQAYCVRDLMQAESLDAERYLRSLEEKGKSPSVLARVHTSLRRFYAYLVQSARREDNPLDSVPREPLEKRTPDILTRSEMRTLFDAALAAGDLGIRDLAMIQSMYYAQLKLSEILALRIGDLNLDMGYIRIGGSTPHERVRVVRLNRALRDALERYVRQLRPSLVREDTDRLFLNYAGRSLTRQGFWKNFQQLLRKVELERDISFSAIRRSFEYHNFGIDRVAEPEENSL